MISTVAVNTGIERTNRTFHIVSPIGSSPALECRTCGYALLSMAVGLNNLQNSAQIRQKASLPENRSLNSLLVFPLRHFHLLVVARGSWAQKECGIPG